MYILNQFCPKRISAVLKMFYYIHTVQCGCCQPHVVVVPGKLRNWIFILNSRRWLVATILDNITLDNLMNHYQFICLPIILGLLFVAVQVALFMKGHRQVWVKVKIQPIFGLPCCALWERAVSTQRGNGF